MPPKGFQCKRCGRCCTETTGGYCHSVDKEQIKYWEKHAPHILKWTEHVYDDIYDCWIDPRDGEEVTKCPWLRIYKSPRYKNTGAHCLIQKWKDIVCREYPDSVSRALSTQCKGFDHLTEAQIKQMLVVELIDQLDVLKNLKASSTYEEFLTSKYERWQKNAEAIKCLESLPSPMSKKHF